MHSTSKRGNRELRPLQLTLDWLRHADGSCLIELGNTRVIAAASLTAGVPGFLRGKGTGWLTAEYGMLPRSTSERMDREAARGKQSGRTVEIQRLIGRALRMAVDLDRLGEHTLVIDCDVLDADGGTRTAAVTAGYVALHAAVDRALAEKRLKQSPIRRQVAAVSVGVVDGRPCLDLDYVLDSSAEVDMNVIMTGEGEFVEVQGTGERAPFSRAVLDELLGLAQEGCGELFAAQRRCLGLEPDASA